MSLKKSITAAILLSTVLSFPSQAYFGQSIVEGACDTVSSTATWVKENPGKAVAITAALGVAAYAAYCGYDQIYKGIVKNDMPDIIDDQKKSEQSFVKKDDLIINTTDDIDNCKCQINENEENFETDIAVCLMKAKKEVALEQYLIQDSVKTLNFKDRDISVDDIKVLVSVLFKTRLEKLILIGKNVNGEALISLAKILPNSQIRDLDLSQNCIACEEDGGLQALMEVLPKSKIETLSLSRNNITDDFVESLAKFVTKSKIESLRLSNNQLSYGGVKKLVSGILKSKLKRLFLINNIGYKDSHDIFKSFSFHTTILTDLNIGGLECNLAVDVDGSAIQRINIPLKRNKNGDVIHQRYWCFDSQGLLEV